MINTIGFLSMRFEEEEKRDFRPGFFEKLLDLENRIILDYGYGEKLGISSKEYTDLNPKIKFCSRNDVLKSDVLISVRTPIESELTRMKKGATIFSMLHYVTHQKRNQLLQESDIYMYAMDSVVDDFGLRMIQDFEGTVRSALVNGFRLLDKSAINNHCKILIIGPGELGKLAVSFSIKLSPVPAIVTCVGKHITVNKQKMIQLLRDTDVLIDSSKRIETNKYIVTNDMIGCLPPHAVIIDISADDYDTKINPIQVKGIEGIPTGNLKKFVFDTDDLAYDSLPDSVKSHNRRKLASCYSWPGVDVEHCLDRYEVQIEPFIRLLASNNVARLENSLYTRALHKASYHEFSRNIPSV